MKTILFSIILVNILINSHHANTRQINTDESRVNFRIGSMRINTAKGAFTGMQGIVQFDPQNLAESSFSVCIDAASVDAGNNQRDKHLREEEYFDVVRFPDICYVQNS